MTHVVETKELDALVSLIDEPNEDMFGEIRKKVMSYGNLAIPVLEEAWVNTLGDNDSKRIESLIEEIRQEDLVLDFNNWAKNSNDLLKGVVLLTKYFQPDFDEELFNSQFEKLVRETWLELNDSLTGLEKIKVINHVFYTVYKFNAESVSTANPDTYFLNKIMHFRKGNPITMGLLYIAIAQKLNIPIFGVDLPGHFVLVFMDDIGDIRLHNDYTESDVLFYINAVKEGAVFTHNEINHYIHQMNINSTPEFFLPCSNLAILKRMMSELIISLETENKYSKTKVLNRLLAGL